eukprot:8511456-Pyramimonas_sp.AAC.1
MHRRFQLDVSPALSASHRNVAPHEGAPSLLRPAPHIAILPGSATGGHHQGGRHLIEDGPSGPAGPARTSQSV